MDFPGAPPGAGLPEGPSAEAPVAPPAPVVSSSSSSRHGPGGADADADAASADGSDKKRSASEAGLAADAAAGSNKELTEQQKLERRERNREHAKRSRLRKKFLLESLQEQIHGLEEQIDGFKAAIKREMPMRAEEIIKNVCGDKEKFTPLPMPSGFGPVKTLMEPDFRLSKYIFVHICLLVS